MGLNEGTALREARGTPKHQRSLRIEAAVSRNAFSFRDTGVATGIDPDISRPSIGALERIDGAKSFVWRGHEILHAVVLVPQLTQGGQVGGDRPCQRIHGSVDILDRSSR